MILITEIEKERNDHEHLSVEEDSNDWPSVSNLVRRHSLSLLNRSPYKGSLADDLLNRGKAQFDAQTTLLRSSIKDLTDVISDYNSCQSIAESSDTDSSIKEVPGFVRKKGKKRNRKQTPEKKIGLEKSEKSEVSHSPEVSPSLENKKKHIKL